MAEITEKELQDYKKLRKSRDKQYERQNKHIKENYYKHSTTFPKGTKERIEAVTSEKLNTFICRVVLAEVQRLESLQNTEFVQEKQISQQIETKSTEKPQDITFKTDSVLESEPKKERFKPITPEEAAELQALIDGKKADEKAAKQKAEKEKKAREEVEQAAKEAEIMGYVEKMRAAQEGIREARREQDKKKIAAVLADAELLAIIREPSNKDCLVDQIGEELYNAILQADKEKQRQESIDRASVEMGQASKPPF